MATPPNIIWVFGDQHPAHLLGCNGNRLIRTPNIDALAANGINFTNAVAGFPLCCPFRGSLLTSQYPHKCVPGHEYRLDPKQKTIAHELNAAGYDTIYLGKWHLDGFHESKGRAAFHIVPPERRGGFQTWIGYENNNLQWDSWVHGGEGATAFHRKLDGYETDALTTIFLEQLDHHIKDPYLGSNPFFAVMSVQPPHNPYLAPEEHMLNHFTDDTFQPKDILFRPNVPDLPKLRQQVSRDLAGAYAMIENIDANLGRIFEFLCQKQIADNTIILFFSDHGDMHGSHGLYRKTVPYEESIKIPCIIGHPPTSSTSAKGRTSNALLNHVDFAPTTMGLCGLKVPSEMRGYNYSHYFRNELPKADEPDSAFLQCVISPLHVYTPDKPWRGIITKDGWKYICINDADWIFGNLNEDPYELINYAHTTNYTDIKLQMRQRLRQWIQKTGDTFSVPKECVQSLK